MPSSTFLGGPYDGLQLVDWTGYRLGDEVEIPICGALIDQLNGAETAPSKSSEYLCGIAVYRVQLTMQGTRFQFMRRRRIEPRERIRLESWLRQALERTTGYNCG